jgi:ketosteroid isomerase-like protein
MGILALSISMFAQTKQSKPDPDNSVSQALKAIEQTWLTAEKNNDTKAFEKLVADDWIAITPDGKSQTKAERAEEVKNGHIESASLGNMKVRVFGSTAVVTGTDDETATVDGKKSTSHYVWTDVFVKREGNWVAVASQTAQLK